MASCVLVLFLCFFLTHNVFGDEPEDLFTFENEYNYTVFIDSPKQGCSGGVIGPKHVVTAAHCVTDDSYEILNSTIKVVVGSDKNYLIDEVIEVAKICTLSSYRPHPALKYDYADVAVLELKSALNPRFVTELVLSSDEALSDYFDKNGTISSFGEVEITEDGEFVSPGYLNYARAKILDKSKCESAWPTVASHIDYERQICAKVQPPVIGSCKGDAGAPLVYDKDGKKIFVGVLSFSPESCDESESSGMYVKIGYYRSFISNIKAASDDVNAKCRVL